VNPSPKTLLFNSYVGAAVLRGGEERRERRKKKKEKGELRTTTFRPFLSSCFLSNAQALAKGKRRKRKWGGAPPLALLARRGGVKEGGKVFPRRREERKRKETGTSTGSRTSASITLSPYLGIEGKKERGEGKKRAGERKKKKRGSGANRGSLLCSSKWPDALVTPFCRPLSGRRSTREKIGKRKGKKVTRVKKKGKGGKGGKGRGPHAVVGLAEIGVFSVYSALYLFIGPCQVRLGATGGKRKKREGRRKKKEKRGKDKVPQVAHSATCRVLQFHALHLGFHPKRKRDRKEGKGSEKKRKEEKRNRVILRPSGLLFNNRVLDIFVF